MSAARSRAAKTGLPPGTLVHVGEAPIGDARTALRIMDYGPGHLEERDLAGLEELAPYLAADSVTWVDVAGVHDVELVARLGALLGVHPLVLEDVVNTHQRPKAELFEDHWFVVVRALRADPATGSIAGHQVSLLAGRGWVVTFGEGRGDLFDPVRERIRGGRGRTRGAGADYLAYALVDVVVDHYFAVLEGLDERSEDLEADLLGRPGPDTLAAIHALKREMLALRRAAWPLRELVGTLERSESTLLDPATRPYLRDLHDHAVQVIEAAETQRDILAGFVDIYLSSVSNRMNEVMKVLTIIATLFIPLTFLAGVYGMNFEHMPELHWRWAYPTLWGIMLTTAGALMWWFRRRGWL